MVQRSNLVVAGIFPLLLFSLFSSHPWAAEKMKLGSGIKMSPIYYLPVTAAEEKGFWKENGLEVEWVPFAGSTPMYQAVAGGALNVALVDAPSTVLAAARGISAAAVSDLQSAELFVVWARTDPRFKEPKDFRGTKCGTPRLGSVAHVYCQVAAKKLGLEKEIKAVSVGGIPEILAGLRTGAIELTAEPTHLMTRLKEQGIIRELFPMSELVPKPWAGHWLIAAKSFARRDALSLKKLVKATLQATNFLQRDQAWSIGKMVEAFKFTPSGAKEMFSNYRFATDGNIPLQAIENLTRFLIEYGLLAREKAPSADEIYMPQFLS